MTQHQVESIQWTVAEELKRYFKYTYSPAGSFLRPSVQKHAGIFFRHRYFEHMPYLMSARGPDRFNKMTERTQKQ